MEALVVWKGRLSFEARAESGFRLSLDADPEVGGSNDGFRPMELMALSLAGCTAMDVISLLRKKRQEVSAFQVRVQAEQSSEHPRVFTAITIEYLVRGRQIDARAVERSIELSRDKYCPAQGMLQKVVPIRHVTRISAEAGEG